MTPTSAMSLKKKWLYILSVIVCVCVIVFYMKKHESIFSGCVFSKKLWQTDTVKNSENIWPIRTCQLKDVVTRVLHIGMQKNYVAIILGKGDGDSEHIFTNPSTKIHYRVPNSRSLVETKIIENCIVYYADLVETTQLILYFNINDNLVGWIVATCEHPPTDW